MSTRCHRRHPHRDDERDPGRPAKTLAIALQYRSRSGSRARQVKGAAAARAREQRRSAAGAQRGGAGPGATVTAGVVAAVTTTLMARVRSYASCTTGCSSARRGGAIISVLQSSRLVLGGSCKASPGCAKTGHHRTTLAGCDWVAESIQCWLPPNKCAPQADDAVTGLKSTLTIRLLSRNVRHLDYISYYDDDEMKGSNDDWNVIMHFSSNQSVPASRTRNITIGGARSSIRLEEAFLGRS